MNCSLVRPMIQMSLCSSVSRKLISKYGFRSLSIASYDNVKTMILSCPRSASSCYTIVERSHSTKTEKQQHVEAKVEAPTTSNLHSYYTGPVSMFDHRASNSFVTSRTHNCGELRLQNVGEKVTLCGWVQFKRMGGKFLILRDGYGVTQIIIPEHVAQESWNLDKLHLESVISVSGTVMVRPVGHAIADMPTGDIEIIAEEFSLINAAKSQLPFSIRRYNKAKESLRMKYRYLDLRFPEMQSRLRLRSSMLAAMRNFLHNVCSFVEVETPTLFRRTPGGAQEFIVPSRLPGRCYTLVQSPQQFKQLLMVGGIDRYFQVARCYRDETSRPDRQPEFTQLDIEMSFSDQKNVMALSEQLISQSWRATVQPELSTEPFPVMTYSEAMHSYGTDKPDTRFDMTIQHMTDHIVPLADTLSPTLREALELVDAVCAAVVVPQGQDVWSSQAAVSHIVSEERRNVNTPSSAPVWLRGLRIPGDPWPDLGEDEHLVQALKACLGAQANPGDLVWLAAGPREETLTLLGRLRVMSADALEKSGEHKVRALGPNFVWVVDFPLFVRGEEPGTLSPAHHPFTQPHPEDEHMLFTDPLKVRGQHYDLVVDGWEVGGGSVRIHDAAMQERVLRDVLNIDPLCMPYLLEGLDSGCPPHAGIAFGVDRLVAVACGAPSIRDVIAFPKGVGGRDPMSNAPVEMTEADQQLYHVQCMSTHRLPSFYEQD